MGLQLYNTLTHTKEPFVPLESGKVRLYVCGPTVYDKAHVGHAMSAIVFDVLRRYLEYRGYHVVHVMNFTDVDDKIIRRANELGMDPFDLAENYVCEYRQLIERLNLLRPTLMPHATQEIETILNMVQALVDKGYAYPVEGSVYFRVARFPGYGKLSGRRPEDMLAGARVEVDERKENPLDFALWKAAKPGEPSWPSPWGRGRPGWHIECSAMNLHHLGEQIDIHGGGNDLIFPHHENEIAQTESLTGKPFARYWVHNGMVQLGGEKMSKSLGNLVTIDQFLTEHSADVLRMMVLNSGYRNPLLFSEDIAQQAERSLEHLRSALKPATAGAAGADAATLQALESQSNALRAGFEQAMDDDLNTAGALAQLFESVRLINQARDKGASEDELRPAQETLRELCGLLGLRLEEEQPAAAAAEPFVDLLVELRGELREQKQWVLADSLRQRLTGLGVEIQDSKEGSSWSWKT
jgi:cysteinyl-tRNA synthetase